MEINIKNLIGKVEIHYHNGGQKEIPCKDEDLCEKMKFNQQVEDIIFSNREKSFQQCEVLFSEFQKKETSDNLKTFQNYALIILPVKP